MVRRSGNTQAPSPQLWDISREGRHLQLQVVPERLAEGAQFIGRIGADQFGLIMPGAAQDKVKACLSAALT